MQLYGKEVALISLLLSLILFFFTFYALATVIFSILAFIYFAIFQKDKKYNFTFEFNLGKESVLIFSTAIFVAIIIAIVFHALNVNDLSKIKEIIKTFDFALIILAVIVSPIAEELFFRGTLIESFHKFGKVFSVLFSSSIFAILHFNYGSFAEIAGAFAIAIVFSYYYAEKREILPLFVAHAMFNLIAIIYYILL